jgi:hypothetical protein
VCLYLWFKSSKSSSVTDLAECQKLHSDIFGSKVIAPDMRVVEI